MTIYYVVIRKGLTHTIFNAMIKFTQNYVKLKKKRHLCICIHTQKSRKVQLLTVVFFR